MSSIRDYLSAPAQEIALPVDHLSASQVNMWDRCKEQWRQRYVLQRKERPGAAVVLGGAFHFAQETNFGQKIQSGEDLSVSDVREAYHAGWDAAIEKNGGVDEVVWDDREKPETTRSRGEVLAVQYREQVAPKLQPKAVEHRFDLEIQHVPVPVIGYIDFIGERQTLHQYGGPGGAAEAASHTETSSLVIDYKTSSRKQTKLKPDWRFQATIYQMVTRLPVEYHVAVKTKEPVIVTPVDEPDLTLGYNEDWLKLMERKLARVAREIAWYWNELGPDQLWPDALLHPWACDYCGFRDTCGWWGR